MNIKLVGKIISMVLLIEAAFMVIPLIIGFADGESDVGLSFLASIGITLAVGGAMYGAVRLSGDSGRKGFYEQEGFIATSFSWILLSLFGCLPFLISRQIPRFIDAWFETVSGFTTTGSSILTNVEAMSRALIYWRSFSHWLGGMGVLVFMMALLPAAGKDKGSDMFLLRAESPGPTVEKFTPRMRSTAGILYKIYIGLTVLCCIFLLFGGMTFFEAVCTALGTAGTGGFGIRNDSMASFSPFAQNVTTVFMLLFGVNFNLYFLILLGKPRAALKNEELRVYLGLWFAATVTVFLNILKMYPTAGEALRHAAFQTASVMTTSGFATTDFEQWGTLSKCVMLMLMLVGASAGSTGGGFKVSRVMLLAKELRRNVHKALRPSRTAVIQMDGKTVSEQTVSNVCAYLVAYVFLIVISIVVVAADNKSITTTITSVIACINNIGPGFDEVGATGNFASFSVLSKLVLIGDMLIGRLEIFPILAMASRTAWSRKI